MPDDSQRPPDRRPKLLFVVSSSCQLYSGTGTALFDWIGYARGSIDISLLIDSANRQNFEIAERFCRDHGVRLYPSEPAMWPGCCDHSPIDTVRLVHSGDWDFVECVSWASAGTNLDVLSALFPTTRLLFTPHTQPLWTLHDADAHFMVPPVLERRSDLVFLDSPDELTHFPQHCVAPERAFFVPLGVDITRFYPAVGPREPVAVSVFDAREHRKRADLLIGAFEALGAMDRGIRFVMAGMGTDRCLVSPALAPRVNRLGYIERDTLVELYQTSAVFVLLSDYEAFGLPIAEALCCGTPVVITRQHQTASLFSDLPGVQLVDNTDASAVAAAILTATQSRPDHAAIARAAIARFAVHNTYRQKLARVLELWQEDAPQAPAQAFSNA